MDPENQSNHAAESAISKGTENQQQDLPLSDSLVGALFKAGSSQPSSGPWQPPAPEELQRHFPQYEIRGILGRGGMGAVYKGWQKSLRRFVAIKILPAGIDDGGMDFAERFKQEAWAMAKFRHPGIVAVHDAGETPEGLLYFIMECVEGKDVAQLVAERGRLQPSEALSIASRVCEAVAYAHERGVIHRDIKPSNVMIEADGAVKVADFGLAKLSSAESTVNTLSSVQIGSLDFMPPEALHGSGNADHRADIYAVGGMLYQMLTGKAPHGRFEPPSVAVPGLDKRFDAIVDKAMHADVAKRYSSATELHSELARIVGTQDAIRSEGSRGSKALFAILLVLAIFGIAAIAFAQWKKNHTEVPSGGSNKTADAEGSEPEAPPDPAIRQNWVKVIPDPSKLPGIAEFEAGWARLSDKEGIQHLSDPGGRPVVVHNGGARAQRRIPQGWHGGILLHARSLEGGRRLNLCYYEPKAPGEKAYLQLRQFQPETLPPNPTAAQAWSAQKLLAEERIPPLVGEITAELIVIGKTARGRIADHIVTATMEDEGKAGRLAVDEANSIFFRDVAVLNLDSLTEAEALKSAGMKTNPGQTTAANAARWHDAFAESPLKEIVSAAERTAQGYRLPGNNHWPVSPQPMRSGALRVRATGIGEKYVSLYVTHDDRQFERIRFLGRNSEWLLSRGVTSSSERDIASTHATSPLDEKPHELLMARIAGRLRVMVDGKPLIDEADPNSTPGRFVLDIFPGAKISVEKVEYLELDGVPEGEALKLVGLDADGKELPPATGASSAPATDGAPKAEAWVDLLLPEAAAMLRLEGIEKLGPDGLIIRENGKATVAAADGTWSSDGALRFRARFESVSKSRFHIRARSVAGLGYGIVVVNRAKVVLQVWRGNQIVDTLKEFDLSDPLEEGHEYEMEMRAVGSTLTARLNGKKLGEVEDNTHPRGAFQVRGAQGRPATILGLEYLDLSASRSSGAGAAVRPLKSDR